MAGLHTKWPTALLLAAAVAVGCGDDDSAGAPAIEDIPDMLAGVFCDTLSACRPFFDMQFGDGCVERTSADLENGDFVYVAQAIEAGTIVYNAGRVNACLGAISAVGCDLFGGSRIPEVCLEAFDGQVAVGGDCSIDAECTGTAFCVANTCPGTCTEPRGEAGACLEDDHCNDGLLCDGQSCAVPRQQGDSCGDTLASCGGGLLCTGGDDDSGTPGTCEPFEEVFALAEGESCDFIAGEFCATGLACVIEADLDLGVLIQSCEPPVASGAACRLALPNHCPDGEYCDGLDTDNGVFEGTCKALPGDGIACAAGSITGCAEGRSCVNGTCRTVRENGGACSDDEECYSENCDSGVCAAPVVCDYPAPA